MFLSLPDEPATAAIEAGAKRPARAALLLALLVGLAVSSLLSLSIGPTGISLDAVPQAIAALLGDAHAESARAALVLFDIRLPRTLLAIFVGAGLAVSGAMLQGMFRNPLADPSLIGISSGAALAAVTVIAFGHGFAAPFVNLLGIHALPVGAFLGGLAVTGVLVGFSAGKRQLSTGALLLTGLALTAFSQALLGLIAFLSDDRALRDLTLWNLGSLAGASWSKVLGVVPFAIAASFLLPRLTRSLNGLLLGEAEAFHLGIDTRRAKLLIVLATALCVGSAVAVAGIIGFVGIVVPHVVRIVAGPDHGTLLPASALLGASLTLVADVIARTIVAPAELPIGIVMAIIGAPFFLHLVLKRGINV